MKRMVYSVLLVLFAAADAQAIMCPSITRERAFAAADVVVEARVEKLSAPEDPHATPVQIQVLKKLKGSIADRATIYTSAYGYPSFSLQAGQTLELYLNYVPESGRHWANACDQPDGDQGPGIPGAVY